MSESSSSSSVETGVGGSTGGSGGEAQDPEEAEVFDDSIEIMPMPRGTDFPLFTTDLVFKDEKICFN